MGLTSDPMRRILITLACVLGLALHANAYPLDGYEHTGILSQWGKPHEREGEELY